MGAAKGVANAVRTTVTPVAAPSPPKALSVDATHSAAHRAGQFPFAGHRIPPGMPGFGSPFGVGPGAGIGFSPQPMVGHNALGPWIPGAHAPDMYGNMPLPAGVKPITHDIMPTPLGEEPNKYMEELQKIEADAN